MQAMISLSQKNLVIFDYSGTLSLEAPRFARPDNLFSALAESGLAKLGVTTPDLLWNEIIGPTWTEGSTTAIGYKQAIAKRIEALGKATGATGSQIAAFASRFVDLYLSSSRIDPLWRPLLETLAGDPGVSVLIATDHYAEATETIFRNLRSWKIPAQTTADGMNHREISTPLPFFIANSADIGFWKSDRRFWEAVRLQLGIATIHSLLIVDDFGFNEEQGDRYGEEARVEVRQKETAAALQQTFETSLTVIPFFLKGAERDRTGSCAKRIAETIRRIDSVLNAEGGATNCP